MPLIGSDNIGGGGGSVGIIIDSQISQLLNSGQTYTVPAGKYAEVTIYGTTSNISYQVGGASTIVAPAATNMGTTHNVWKLGPGATVTSSGNSILIRGVLFANG